MERPHDAARLATSPALDFTVGRVTNDDLERAVAVWFKDELADENVGPIWIQVGGSAPDDANPIPADAELVPFHVPERTEWFEASFAAELAGDLGLPVVWS